MSFVNTVEIVGDEALSTSIINRSITEIADNNLTKIGQYAFNSCRVLTKVDFPAVTSIGGYAFYSCALTTVILRNETVCSLSSSDAFSSTPIKSGTGYIYVPRALLEDYKAATNWSNFAAQFRALEDYTVDGTITGELDTTKI